MPGCRRYARLSALAIEERIKVLAMRMDYHLNILKVKVSDRQKEFPWFLKQSIVLHNTNCALIRKLNDDRFTFVCHRTESLPVVGAW